MADSLFSRLSKEHIIAKPGFNRWFVPPAALAIHLCIGQAYAFSVFKIPLTRLIGGTASVDGDWSQPQLAWIFTTAIAFLGLSTAVFGPWLEKAGPRKSGIASALCWSSGFLLSALGVYLHQLWLLYVGYGVIGGCGLGMGYITPVSTLMRWFPDRRGMAAGFAVMGFGGGAMIASPLSQALIDFYTVQTSAGPDITGAVIKTFLTFGTVYLVAMVCGALAFRVPPAGWRPEGWTPSSQVKNGMVTTANVHANDAIRTPAFYLLWGVLFLNVTAGIGILEQASPMIQEIFQGRVSASAAAGFVGLLSIFNMTGRFGWSSLSDHFGRRTTFFLFFVIGAILFVCLPFAGRAGNIGLFVASAALVLTMYGGGFSTIQAYLVDVFGTAYVGVILGRLLTAWACAGVAGPVLVNYVREYQIARGVAPVNAYDTTMYIMSGLLMVGFFLNLMIRPVHERYHIRPPTTPPMKEAEKRVIAPIAPLSSSGFVDATWSAHSSSTEKVKLALAWAAVILPLSWGIFMTLKKALQLFG